MKELDVYYIKRPTLSNVKKNPLLFKLIFSYLNLGFSTPRFACS